MANFFGMGFNCRYPVPGFLIFFSCAVCCLAQFSASDSDELYNIRRNTDAIESDVDSILSAVTGDSTLYSVQLDMYHFLRGNNGVGGIPNIISLLNDLSGKADTANSSLSDIYSELGDQSSILTTIHNLLNLRLTNIQADIREGNDYLSLIRSGIDNDVSILTQFQTLTGVQLQDVLNSLGVVNQNLGYLGIPLQSIDSKLVVSEDGIKVYSTTEDEISQSLHDIAVSFTNFMNKAPMAYEPAFLTNYYASILPFMPTLPITGYINRYYQLLFGHSPSTTEANNFLASYRATSFIGGYYDVFSLLSPDSLDPRYASHYNSFLTRLNSAMMDLGLNASQANNEKSTIQNFGRLRYYQYGTRPLLEFFEQATNDYPLTGSPVLSSSVSDGRRNASFSSGFVQTVESLASSFTPSVDTNIASVATNEIQDVENSSIVKTWGDAKKTSADDYPLSSLTASVNDIVSQGSSSVLGVFSEDGRDSLVFDFPVQFDSVKADLHYDIPSTSVHFRPYVLFFAGIVKCIIVVIFGLSIWEKVVKEIWMGRRF